MNDWLVVGLAVLTVDAGMRIWWRMTRAWEWWHADK